MWEKCVRPRVAVTPRDLIVFGDPVQETWTNKSKGPLQLVRHIFFFHDFENDGATIVGESSSGEG